MRKGQRWRVAWEWTRKRGGGSIEVDEEGVGEGVDGEGMGWGCGVDEVGMDVEGSKEMGEGWMGEKERDGKVMQS